MVTFGEHARHLYYAADGTKLKTVHGQAALPPTDYCGNVVYENGVQSCC